MVSSWHDVAISILSIDIIETSRLAKQVNARHDKGKQFTQKVWKEMTRGVIFYCPLDEEVGEVCVRAYDGVAKAFNFKETSGSHTKAYSRMRRRVSLIAGSR